MKRYFPPILAFVLLLVAAQCTPTKKDKPEDMSFQINTLEYRSPSVFLKIGDNVLKDKFKIIKFEFKEQENPAVGGLEEVSELT